MFLNELFILGSDRGDQNRFGRLLCLGYWLSEVCPSFCCPRQHSILIIGSVSVVRGKGVDPPAQLGPLYRADLNLLTTRLT